MWRGCWESEKHMISCLLSWRFNHYLLHHGCVYLKIFRLIKNIIFLLKRIWEMILIWDTFKLLLMIKANILIVNGDETLFSIIYSLLWFMILDKHGLLGKIRSTMKPSRGYSLRCCSIGLLSVDFISIFIWKIWPVLGFEGAISIVCLKETWLLVDLIDVPYRFFKASRYTSPLKLSNQVSRAFSLTQVVCIIWLNQL